LVTGGAGFLGANFVRTWSAAHPTDHLVVLDALTYAGDRTRLSDLEARGAIHFVVGDICDEALAYRIFTQHQIDTVVHFAAESHVDRSIVHGAPFVRTNVLGTQALLDAARAAWCVDGTWKAGVRFHHVSTDEVYGPLADDTAPFNERSPYHPSSPYSASKAASDHLVRAAGVTHGLPYSISHCANNYGPYQHAEKLIPFMLTQALQGLPLTIYGDGLQRREWLSVHDHCMALDAILCADVAGETFCIGGGTELTNLELVHQLCDALDAHFAGNASLGDQFPQCPAALGAPCRTLITHVADRPGHDRRYALDSSKLRALTGSSPATHFAAGLEEVVAAMLSRGDPQRP
jgi:dTDP-glucose 4,6-dehydratase